MKNKYGLRKVRIGKMRRISYKKFIHSPFRYAGGKFYALKFIIKLIPPHSFYMEPFAGGACVFFAKGKIKDNWLNDLDAELMNCFTVIRDNPEQLADFLKDEKALKKRHYHYKSIFKPKSNLEKAARWFYLNRTSYSGIMKMENCYWGYGDKYSLRPFGWRKRIFDCSKKLQNVKLTCLDFEQVINNAPDGAFLLVDPPYYNTSQDKFYSVRFSKKDHYRLVEVLKKNNDRLQFLLTYDDNEDVRKMYSWCPIITPRKWFYTINRTDDQKNKTKRKGRRKKGNEIFILNYLESSPPLDFYIE